MVKAPGCEAYVLRSIHIYDELLRVHYVDRQHALIQWVLWTGKVSIVEKVIWVCMKCPGC